MKEASHRYRLYDRLVVSERPTGLAPAGAEGPAGDPWRLSWREGEGPTEEGLLKEGARVIHDAADLIGDKRLKVLERRGRLIFFYGQIRLVWDEARREAVIHRWEEGALPVSDFLERLAAPIAALCDADRWWLALHASAVVDRRGRAWVLIGESGAGKSTAALELSRRGMALAADDLVLIDVESGALYGASPTVRLVDREQEVPEADEARPVPSGIDKRWYRLGLEPAPPTSELAALVWLDPRGEEEGVDIRPLAGQAGVSAVLAQAFGLDPGPAGHKVRRFRGVCELGRVIDLYRLRYAQSDRRSPAQVDALEGLMEEGRP